MSTIRIRYSILNKSQRKLLRATEKNVAFLGGFGSGKTTGIALKALQLNAMNPGVPGLITAPVWRTLWSVVYTSISHVFTRCGFEPPKVIDKNHQCYMDFGNGTPIYMRSANRPESFDGLNVGWSVNDEARYIKRSAKDVILGRVRMKCMRPQNVWGSTPEYGWLSDEFNSGKPNRKIIIAKTMENAHNLSEDFIDNIRTSYSLRMQKAYIDGEFVVLEGAVYENFDDRLSSDCLVDFDPHSFPMIDSKVRLAIDPGFRRSAVLWMIEPEPRQYIVFDELMLNNKSDKEMVREINKRRWPIDEVCVDTAARAKQSYEGMSTLTALRNIRMRRGTRIVTLRGPNRDIPFGIDKTRSLIGTPGNRRIVFAKRLLGIEKSLDRGVIKDLNRYRYKEIKDGRAVDDKPLKDGTSDHSMDALRYLSVYLWLSDPALRRTDPTLDKRVIGDGYGVDR